MTHTWRDQLGALRDEGLAATGERGDWAATAERARRMSASAVALHLTVGGNEVGLAGGPEGSDDVDELLSLVPHDVDEGTLQFMPPAAVARLAGRVQSQALEMQVQEGLASGDLSLPDGAVRFEASPRAEDDVAGYFTDEGGQIVAAVQVAGQALNVAAGMSTVADMVSSSTDVTEDLVPGLTLALIGAELALTWASGGDVNSAKSKARERAGTALTINAAGAALSALTGVSGARLGVAGAVRAVKLTEAQIKTRTDPAIARIRELRHVVGELGL
jgi:hypothetical protein